MFIAKIQFPVIWLCSLPLISILPCEVFLKAVLGRENIPNSMVQTWISSSNLDLIHGSLDTGGQSWGTSQCSRVTGALQEQYSNQVGAETVPVGQESGDTAFLRLSEAASVAASSAPYSERLRGSRNRKTDRPLYHKRSGTFSCVTQEEAVNQKTLSNLLSVITKCSLNNYYQNFNGKPHY